MAVLEAALGYRDDDHAASRDGATPLRVIQAPVVPELAGRAARVLGVFAGSLVPATTLSESGIIERPDDEDYFSFRVEQRSRIQFTVDVSEEIGNLDAKLRLLDANGNQIGDAADPADFLDATIAAELDAGTYYLVVSSHGGSSAPLNEAYHTFDVGSYTIRGTIGGERMEHQTEPMPRREPIRKIQPDEARRVPSLLGPRMFAVTPPAGRETSPVVSLPVSRTTPQASQTMRAATASPAGNAGNGSRSLAASGPFGTGRKGKAALHSPLEQVSPALDSTVVDAVFARLK